MPTATQQTLNADARIWEAMEDGWQYDTVLDMLYPKCESCDQRSESLADHDYLGRACKKCIAEREAEDARIAADGPMPDTEEQDAWSGGFAENH